jgi:hypothetical protein
LDAGFNSSFGFGPTRLCDRLFSRSGQPFLDDFPTLQTLIQIASVLMPALIQ